MNRAPLQNRSQCLRRFLQTARLLVFLFALFVSFAGTTFAAPTILGDLDADGLVNVYDLTRLRAHIRGTKTLPANLVPFADVNGDGFLNEDDAVALIHVIVGANPAKTLPLASIRETSPFAGESGVALTREVIVRFTMPLSVNATLTTWDANTQTPGDLQAEAGGRKLLTRVELSGDRTKATLFFLEPVPASTRVTVTFDGVGLNDLLERQIDPAANNLATGGVFTFTYDTAPITPVPGTGIIGHIYASERAAGATIDTPLPGALVRVVGSETLQTFTAADGSFSLNPCPGGRFFVEVDGRTSPVSQFPDGTYYPYIVKAWEAIPGRADNLAAGTGTIYLPRIAAGALKTVSAATETKVSFLASVVAQNPALAGTELNVPANALFADDGTRGGKVGIAPVAPDRLPEPLPPGLGFPLVITVQTDGGTNFDRPVPVRFPNLPDPVTGIKLKPGEKSALWSYNHDKGAWEIVGPMTVSDDGNFVVSDVGVGIRQPGWHGTQPGCQGNGQVDLSECHRGLSGEFNWAYGKLSADAGFLANDVDDFVSNDVAKLKIKGTDFFSNVGLLKNYLTCLKPDEPLLDKASTCTQFVFQFSLNVMKEQRLAAAIDTPATFSPIGFALLFGGAVLSAQDVAGRMQELKQQAQLDEIDRENCILIKFAQARRAAKEAALAAARAKLEAAADAATAALETQRPVYERIQASRDMIAPVIAKIEANREGGLGPFDGFIEAEKNMVRDEIQKTIDALEELKGKPFLPTLIAGVVAAGEGYKETVDAEVVRPPADPGMSEPPSPLLSTPAYCLLETGDFRERFRSAANGAVNRILRPRASYLFSMYDPIGKRRGRVFFVSATVGGTRTLPIVEMRADTSLDFDGDGLSDEAEFIIGTDPKNHDTDGDGFADGTEVEQGTDPLSGLAVQTGVIATVDTPGNAVDVVALNNLVAVADSAAGVAIFNVTNALNPFLLAQIETPGDAKAVAMTGNLLAVADGTGGLQVIDLAFPGGPQIVGQRSFGASADAVAVAGTLAYVGLANGQIAVVDMLSGTEIERVNFPSGPVHDVRIAANTLYAVAPGKLYALPLSAVPLAVAGSANFTGSPSGRHHIFAGGGLAYISVSNGYNIFSIANPALPAFIRRESTAQNGWKQIVSNGSGIGFAALGVLGPDDVSLYDLRPAGTTTAFLTTFPTPGLAQAVAIYNGLGFVADGAAGLSVVNYLAYDNKGQAPTISITTNFGGVQAEEGKLVSVTATVTDDVQVRNVEFYVDGVRVVTDGNFPFEYSFLTPLISPTKTIFTLRAKATDTGGNFAWSDTRTIALTPDATPPTVKRFTPREGALTGKIGTLAVTFSEAINAATLGNTTVTLTSAGPDGLFGGADDVIVIPPNGVAYSDSTKSATLLFPAGLPPALYRLTVGPPLADLAGNALAAPVSATFRVFGFTDTDGDGIPDDVEPLLGLDPNNPDTNHDGVPDGREDFDHDVLSNAGEIYLGTDPRNPDTNGNGIKDGDEDEDLDGLKNGAEVLAGSDPFKVDTDGDGLDDATEVATGTSPLSPNGARFVIATAPVSYLNGLTDLGLPGSTVTIISQPVSYLNAITELGLPGSILNIISQPVSYLNTQGAGIPAGSVFQISTGIVSYKNNP